MMTTRKDTVMKMGKKTEIHNHLSYFLHSCFIVLTLFFQNIIFFQHAEEEAFETYAYGAEPNRETEVLTKALIRMSIRFFDIRHATY